MEVLSVTYACEFYSYLFQLQWITDRAHCCCVSVFGVNENTIVRRIIILSTQLLSVSPLDSMNVSQWNKRAVLGHLSRHWSRGSVGLCEFYLFIIPVLCIQIVLNSQHITHYACLMQLLIIMIYSHKKTWDELWALTGPLQKLHFASPYPFCSTFTSVFESLPSCIVRHFF